MNLLEKVSTTIRHSGPLKHASWLWSAIRPGYELVLSLVGRNGLQRNINGMDTVRLPVSLRNISETYEPGVWKHLMLHVKEGDVVADVGAYIGLYTIALAKRVGRSGKVISFEPDSDNFSALRDHITLNKVLRNVRLIHAAVGVQDGIVAFAAGPGIDMGSHISYDYGEGTQTVRGVSLNTTFAESRLDILKIDVEGYEEGVLKGADMLLGDRTRAPRLIYIEVHPFAWSDSGTTSESLLNLLERYDYSVMTLDGHNVEAITDYGEIVAEKKSLAAS